MNEAIINQFTVSRQINISKQCECCGSTFSVNTKDAWKKICYQCFIWVRAGKNISLAASLIKKLEL